MIKILLVIIIALGVAHYHKRGNKLKGSEYYFHKHGKVGNHVR